MVRLLIVALCLGLVFHANGDCGDFTNSWYCSGEDGCCWDGDSCEEVCLLESKTIKVEYEISDVPDEFGVQDDINNILIDAIMDMLEEDDDAEGFTISPLLEDNCGDAPLCGQDNQVINPFATSEFDFVPCCPLNDTTKTEECQVINPVSSCRTATAEEPFCSPITECEEREAKLQVYNLTFEVNNKEICCDTCKCYGDPRCISFNGTADIWALCDSRGPNKNGRCAVSEDVCASQLDHEGNRCMWQTDPKFSEAAAIGKYGSPCIPNNESATSELLMYSADDYLIMLYQHERGVIIGLTLNVGGYSYEMTAETCVNDEVPTWTSSNGTTLLPDYFRETVFVRTTTDSTNILWVVQDPLSNIVTRIRCVAVFYDDIDDFGVPRINVESVTEPDASWATTRSNLGGYCATASMTKTGTTNITDLIEDPESGYCTTYDLQEDTAIAKYVCSETSQIVSAVDCFESFCSKYYFFAFDNFVDCVNEANDNFGEVFCKITTTDDQYGECMDELADFDWQSAVANFLVPFLNETGTCTDLETTSLPQTLTTCTDGIALQYLPIVDGEWQTFEVYPAKNPPCGGEVTYEYNEVTEPLFIYPIRLLQCSSATVCAGEICKQTPGANGALRFMINPPPTFSPTQSPTIEPTARGGNPPVPPIPILTLSPTVVPTKVPSDSPSSGPTISPTGTPSASPSVSPTTSSPTSSPTTPSIITPNFEPTMSPTTISPTISPTSTVTYSPTQGHKGWGPVPVPTVPTSFMSPDPTNAPTYTPTEGPTAGPTMWPTYGPTKWPTWTPTKKPSSSPTMSPSKSPSYSPSTTPSTSPSYSPTVSPSTSPSMSPTTSPTAGPTMWPTWTPTKNPSYSPTISPTTSPTVAPHSRSPTSAPTVSPTTSPSYSPSASPSVSPTTSPSMSPTTSPTMGPSNSPTQSPAIARPPVTDTPTKSPTKGGGGWLGRRVLSSSNSVGEVRRLDDTITIVGSTDIVFESITAAKAYAQSSGRCESFLESYNNNPEVVGTATSCKFYQAKDDEGASGVAIGYTSGDAGTGGAVAAGLTTGAVVGIVFAALAAVYLILLARKHILGPKESTELI